MKNLSIFVVTFFVFSLLGQSIVSAASAPYTIDGHFMANLLQSNESGVQEQQVEFVPSSPLPGDVFYMDIDGMGPFSYTVQGGDDVSDITYGITQAFNTSDQRPLGVGCDDQGTRVYCYGNTSDVYFDFESWIVYASPDTTPPQITINGENFVGIQSATGYIDAGSTFTEPVVTWIDNRDGPGTVTGTGDIVNTSVTGSYVRTYTASDNSFNATTHSYNTTTVTYTYIVQDISAPGLELIGLDEVTQQIDYGQYYDEGANWYDDFDGEGTITGAIIEDNRSTSGTGTYVLAYIKTDRSGNEREIHRTVNMIDTIAPSIGKVRVPTNPIDADYFFTDWTISGANTVSMTGTSLTGLYSPKLVSRNNYRVFIPLTQNAVNNFTITATDVSGNVTIRDFSLTESGTGEIGQVGSLTSTGGSTIVDVSEVTGTSTGATKVVPKVPMTIRDVTGEWSAQVVVPLDTEITRKGGGTFDVTKIETKLVTLTGGLSGNDRSRGAIDFGPSGVPLLFSKPVKVEFYIDRTYTGNTIEVKVRHGGEATFTTSGLTNNPNATCMNGVASSGTNIGSVDTESKMVTIYTCAASTYAAVTTDGTSSTTTSTSSSSSSGGRPSSSVPTPITIATIPVNTPTATTPTKVITQEVFTNTTATPKKTTTISTTTTLKTGTIVNVYRTLNNGKKIKVGTARVVKGTIKYTVRQSGTYSFAPKTTKKK